MSVSSGCPLEQNCTVLKPSRMFPTLEEGSQLQWGWRVGVEALAESQDSWVLLGGDELLWVTAEGLQARTAEFHIQPA